VTALRYAGILLYATGVVTAPLCLRWQVDPLPRLWLTPPAPEFGPEGRPSLRIPGHVFVLPVASFRDELFAYLMFQHYRLTLPRAGEAVLLHVGDRYAITLVLTNDWVAAVDRAAELSAGQSVPKFAWEGWTEPQYAAAQSQTKLFVAAYNQPVHRRMEELPKAELQALLRRFLRFKSSTDPRIRRRIEPVPAPLNGGQAQELAGDIIRVAEFYQLPLELMLGIGAMENNYMDVRGDLRHSIWKRRPAKDDIVLERRNGRVRVWNYATGVWQITRETLREVHRLYLRDQRDYARLPARLRPPKELNVAEVSPAVLTTYAGLLLRSLLDRFDGDVALAVGAYNGGPGKPNLRYHEGVRAVAEQARQILEQAAVLNGEAVMETRWKPSP
jgi:hypothetical protein